MRVKQTGLVLSLSKDEATGLSRLGCQAAWASAKSPRKISIMADAEWARL